MCGLDVIGQVITVLWQLLNGPKLLLSIIIEDLILLNYSQDPIIVNGEISLRILVGYVKLTINPLLMLMIWLLRNSVEKLSLC